MLAPRTNRFRSRLSLDGLWRFRVQTEADTAAGAESLWPEGFEAERLVAVPASFNEQFSDYATFNHMGKVWYARRFEVPAALASQELWLHFAAVNYAARVYLNGQFLGSHETGYTPFAFPVGAALRGGANELVVCVDCALTPHTVPQGGFDKAAIPGLSSPFHPSVNFDFFPYSGIHRSVSLLALPPRHLDSLFIDTALVDGSARIQVRGQVVCRDGASVRLRVETQETTAGIEADGSFAATLRVTSPRLWDVGRPELYELLAEILDPGGEVTDLYHQTFGIRTVAVEGDRLLLNGRPVYLTGFGRHEDFAVLGRCGNDAVNVRDLELLQWIGANSFRTAHYPCDSAMLDLADRLGILVISESPAVSMIPAHATGETLALHCQALREQMRRDYNHPSVVMWCVANEAHTHTEAALPYFERVFAAARAEDSTRPLLLVMCYWPNEKCHALCDIVGVNAYPGWYGGGDTLENTAAYFSGFLDDLRARTGKPILITEMGADALAGLHSLPASLWTEDYQTALLQTNLDVIRSKDYILGEQLWAFADFHTAQNHFRAHGNRKGLFTRDRQPKAAAHMLRARWRNNTGAAPLNPSSSTRPNEIH